MTKIYPIKLWILLNNRARKDADTTPRLFLELLLGLCLRESSYEAQKIEQVMSLHEKLFNGSRTMVFLVNLHMTYNQLLLTFFW